MSLSAPWTLSMPVPVEFGPGALEKLPGRLSGLRRALVVTGRTAMKKAGVTDRLAAVLGAHARELVGHQGQGERLLTSPLLRR